MNLVLCTIAGRKGENNGRALQCVPCNTLLHPNRSAESSEHQEECCSSIKVLVRGCGFMGGADAHAVRPCERARSMRPSAAAAGEKLN